MTKKKDTVEITFQEGLISNGALADACGMPTQLGLFGLPSGVVGGNSEQISNTGTLFKNLRWYLVSNFRQLLSELYVEIGLVQTIVDVPVDDAFRGGIEFKSKQLSEEQLQELTDSMDRDGDLKAVIQACKWNRLFGGAGIVILTDQDPSTPLNLDAISEEAALEFRAVDMWELYFTAQNTEGYNPTIQEEEFEHYNYYGEKLHKSRVMRLKGLEGPSFIRPRLRGWGFSVVETLVRSMNQYLKATDLAYEVLDEFKLDVYKIKNLVNTLLSPNGKQKVTERVQLANWQKNYQNAVVMDSEDEFDHKQLSFAGLAEAMQGIRIQVAADMRMPLTKLFGLSATGFASGEDDIEVYNAMVEAQVRGKSKYDVLKVGEIKCKKLFGVIPDDLTAEFQPLRVMSAEQEQKVKDSKFNRLIAAKSAGEITTKEFRDAVNRGKLMDISLDTSDAALNEVDEEAEEDMERQQGAKDEEGGEEGGDEKPTKDAKDEGKPMGGSSAQKVKNSRKPWKPLVVHDGVIAMPRRYTALERMERVMVINSIAYDVAAYEADGGDDWILPGRKPLFEDPQGVDQGLWSRAKQASQAAFGEEKWQFVTWWYKKQGGKFS